MKKAFILSSYIPTDDIIWVGKEYLDMLVKNFQDYDIYIGVNPSTPEWVKTIEEYSKKINITYGITKDNLVIDSDASAFQTALSLVKQKNIKYELVWFGHTKGVTSNKHDFRHVIYKIFLDKKNIIEDLFEQNKDLGLFSPYMYKIKGKKWDNYINNNLRCILKGDYENNTNKSCYYTHYVLRGEPLYRFLNEVDEAFFNSNLLTLGVEQKFDRYFFERDFPMIIEKYGYGSYPEPIKDGDDDFEWVKKYR